MRTLISSLLELVPAFLLAVPLALLASCAGQIDTTAPTEDSHFGNVLIQFRDFRPGGALLTMANEAAVDRVDYYSEMRSSAGVKVASDEIMNALVEVFEDEGFWDSARPGNPPENTNATEAGMALHGVLSIEANGKKGWITFRKGLTKDELELFQTCSQAFVAIYNSTAGYQRIDNPEGDALFNSK